jgi:CubicO group peptidase (beta-lactamase class C family)
MVYLQVVIEKMTGRGLEELAQEKVFEPLGMENSAYQWEDRWKAEFARGHNTKGEGYGKDIDNEPRAPSTLETTASDYVTFMEAVLQKKLISEASYNEIFSSQVRIRSKTQFGPGSLEETDKYDDINLSYGLGWGLINTPHGPGAFKEGHGNGFQHYTILFPEAGKGIMILTNSDNGEGIFKELLELAIGDTYTPWEWENYIPYQER